MNQRRNDLAAVVVTGLMALSLGLSLTLGLPGCGQREGEEEILARVDDATLTLDEFLSQIPEEVRPLLTRQNMENHVKRWADTQLFYREAMRRGLDRDPEVAPKLENLRREILVGELLSREMEEKAQVTDEDVAAYYREHEDDYATEIKVAHILVSTPGEAQRILEEIRADGDFAELARAWSLDESSRERGGELPYFTRGSGVPDFEDACFALELGEVSDVVETGYGYHVIKMISHRPAGKIVVLEEIEDELRGYMMAMRQDELLSSWLDELRAGARIELNLGLLERIEPALPGGGSGAMGPMDAGPDR
jgi:peptidyl-prolyl cis-trans isomerase C